jgi:TolB protein
MISKYVVGLAGLFLFSGVCVAQTDIRVSGAEVGFPVAVPQLCNASNAAEYAAKVPEVITRDLQISGLFKVLNPGTFVETPGKCSEPNAIAYSDWSVIGAEGLVKGEVREKGDSIEVVMYLHDVQQQRAVVAKRYEAAKEDYAKVAHRFANEIMGHFTGEKGVFGTEIAYVSRVGRFKELFMMGIDGSGVRQITRDRGLALSPSWAPGGDKIIFTSYASRRPELYVVSPKGGKPQRITKRPGLELGAKFSRDGNTILTASSVSGLSKISLFDLRGRVLKRLTTGSAIDVSPSWSPDGEWFAFCSNRGGGPQIYISRADGTGRPKRVSFADSNYCTSPAWSPKGDRIAFVCRRGGHQIFMSSPRGGQATQLTFSGNNEDPNWSPDGRFIAMSSNLGRGGPRNIAILSLLGGSPTQISFAKSEDSQPAWSPMLD